MDPIALILCLLALGLPSAIFGWFCWELYRTGKEFDDQDDL